MAGGPMVITCSHEEREYMHGGLTQQEVDDLLPFLREPQYGITVVRVYDGIAEAQAQFPPGTRVFARRKYWKSQVGTVAADGGEWHCFTTSVDVPVRFDGDDHVLGWWASGLEVIGVAAADTGNEVS